MCTEIEFKNAKSCDDTTAVKIHINDKWRHITSHSQHAKLAETIYCYMWAKQKIQNFVNIITTHLSSLVWILSKNFQHFLFLFPTIFQRVTSSGHICSRVEQKSSALKSPHANIIAKMSKKHTHHINMLANYVLKVSDTQTKMLEIHTKNK